jgi:hypothetical protein
MRVAVEESELGMMCLPHKEWDGGSDSDPFGCLLAPFLSPFLLTQRGPEVGMSSAMMGQSTAVSQSISI